LKEIAPTHFLDKTVSINHKQYLKFLLERLIPPYAEEQSKKSANMTLVFSGVPISELAVAQKL
jgi:hypothetical protein